MKASTRRRRRVFPLARRLHHQPRLAHRGAGGHGDDRRDDGVHRPRRVRALSALRRERPRASPAQIESAAGALRPAPALQDAAARRRGAQRRSTARSGTSRPSAPAGASGTSPGLAGAGAGRHRLHAVARHARGDGAPRRPRTPHRPLLKLKLGGEGDIGRLEAVRARRARAPGSSSTPTRAGPPRSTPRSRPALVRLGVELVEQPLPAGADEALAEIDRGRCRSAPTRAATTAPRWPALAGKYDMVNIKLDKTGGLTEALALRPTPREAAGLRDHGRLHGRLEPRHGAGGAARAGRGARRPRRAAAAGARPRRIRCVYDAAGVHPPDAGALGVSMSRIVYVNGDYLPEEEAKISVFDRGFLFADGGLRGDRACSTASSSTSPATCARLHRSLGELEMPAPASDAEIEAIHRELVARNAPRPRAWSTCRSPAAPPTATSPIRRSRRRASCSSPRRGRSPTRPAAARRHQGRSPSPTSAGRGATSRRCSCSRRRCARCWRRRPASDDAWLVEDGFVTEGTSNNAWIVTARRRHRHPRPLERRSCTASPAPRCCAYAREAQMRVEERPFTLAEAQRARPRPSSPPPRPSSRRWSRSTARPVGDGRPGPVTRRLRELYLAESRRARHLTRAWTRGRLRRYHPGQGGRPR